MPIDTIPIHKLFHLQGKKVIIMGATGSIGFACAEALLSFGASIILVGRNSEKLKQAETVLHSIYEDTKFEKQNTNIAHIETQLLDLSNLEQLHAFFSSHSDVDILINSVGINIPKRLLAISEADYDTLMQINVKNAFFQTQYFVEAKTKNTNRTNTSPGVSIIHISSQMGLVGGDERSIYCASKHALQGMCKAMALELGQWNMRINTICPTFIETELTRATLADPLKKKHITQSIVFGRLGQVQDIYGAVVYLASDASSLVTGSAITVDGGWTAR